MILQHRNVLIIDKCAKDRETYRHYLQQESRYIYKIFEAESGVEGLRFCTSIKPNVILLDFLLPDINGLNFLTNLSEQMGDSKPPVIMITSDGCESVAVQAMKRGVCDYLVKHEMTLESLLQSIQCAIENRELSQQLKASKEQLQERLQKSEEQLRFVFLAANVGFWDWDLITDTAVCSDKYYELHGFELGTPISYQISLASVLEEDKERVDENVRRALEERTKLNIEFRILHPTLGVRWLAAIGQTFYNAEGTPYRMMGMVLDISERKKADEELQQSQHFTQQIIETVSGVFYINDLNEQRNIYVNRQIAELLGYTTEQVQQMGNKLFNQILHPEDFKQLPVHIEKLQRASDTDVFEIEYRMLHADGEWRWFFTREIVYRRTADGSASQILGFSQDISKRKQTEGALQKSREEAEFANRTKDEFIAIVSHELRSPLNAIVGWTKLLKNREFDPATLSRGLETIERNTQTQIQLIEDLLDISRMIRSNLRLMVSPVNLATVLETTVNSMRFAAEAKQQQLQVRIETDSCKVSGDLNRLQQIFNNLLSNAIKFTPSGGQVEIFLEKVSGEEPQFITGSYAKIRVTDTGQGIKPDFLPHIFEPFCRQSAYSTARGKDGLGLGLAIVRHIVELHSGNITVFSAGEGQGATFIVKLPLLED
jgi:PAS domain S-box-containing protein